MIHDRRFGGLAREARNCYNGRGRRIESGPLIFGATDPPGETNRMASRTLYEKIWNAHLVREASGQPS
ncbi:MAG: hypothetical protein ACRD4M_02215, partial [Candidatus Acidiferrales bacterium]